MRNFFCILYFSQRSKEGNSHLHSPSFHFFKCKGKIVFELEFNLKLIICTGWARNRFLLVNKSAIFFCFCIMYFFQIFIFIFLNIKKRLFSNDLRFNLKLIKCTQGEPEIAWKKEHQFANALAVNIRKKSPLKNNEKLAFELKFKLIKLVFFLNFIKNIYIYIYIFVYAQLEPN